MESFHRRLSGLQAPHKTVHLSLSPFSCEASGAHNQEPLNEGPCIIDALCSDTLSRDHLLSPDQDMQQVFVHGRSILQKGAMFDQVLKRVFPIITCCKEKGQLAKHVASMLLVVEKRSCGSRPQQVRP